jgi:prevent-host-death family protein
MLTTIPASEAKAKFSELLDRVQSGESFSITLHGEEAAKLVPAKRPSLEEVQRTIAAMKASRSVLNPPGQPKLRVKDLVNEGRP